jgi:hypothetical protein
MARRAIGAPSQGFSFELQPAPGGFWLVLDGLRGGSLQLTYAAAGVGGHQRVGEVEMQVTADQSRLFVDLNFDVVSVAITSASCKFGADSAPSWTGRGGTWRQKPERPALLPGRGARLARRASSSGIRAEPLDPGRGANAYGMYPAYGQYEGYGQYGMYGQYELYGLDTYGIYGDDPD